MASLLEIDRLTIRFGGITAVENLDLKVEEGTISAVIGPNGAGKTTVFNAITGIYRPTEGEIRFAGKELARPVTPKFYAACAAVGLLTALSLAVLGANVDLLWLAGVRRPFEIAQLEKAKSSDASSHRFTLAQAARECWDAFCGRRDLLIKPQLGRWTIEFPEKQKTIGRFASLPEAITARESLTAAVRSAVLPPPTISGKSTAEVSTFLQEVRLSHARRAFLKWCGFLCGGVLGSAGFAVVWLRSRHSCDVVSRGGIARTFQNIRLFHNMTVLENVLVGMDRSYPFHWLGMLVGTKRQKQLENECLVQARELLRFMGLETQEYSLAKNLPYGDQRRLEIARALASKPRLLLLDEPAAGMNPAESEDLMHVIRKIRERGITILLIEHHMKLVMGISDRIAVLEFGEKIAEGTAEEVRANPKVIQAYLGEEEVS